MLSRRTGSRNAHAPRTGRTRREASPFGCRAVSTPDTILYVRSHKDMSVLTFHVTADIIPEVSPNDKSLVWMDGEVKTPPF
jgi:hypothetical protein